jgi:DNA polymerase-4
MFVALPATQRNYSEGNKTLEPGDRSGNGLRQKSLAMKRNQGENVDMQSLASPSAEPRVSWLFLDLNSYFASVEQELRPELRGHPVAVVPVLADTTACIAASYEAKAFGVKTGVQVGEAKRMCPGLILIEARHRAYVEYHHRIIQAVERCVPVSAVMSIDEMACSLIGLEQPLLAALALASRIKASIREHAGETLRCSIGLAPNRYLAKIASDMEKPDGCVALTPDILHAALSSLTLRDLPGVGARMEKRLRDAGIQTMPQLLALDREAMHNVWGSTGGEKIWRWLRGEDFNDPALEHQKSISQSHVLPPELRTEEGAHAVLHKLLHKAAMRLRTARLWTTHVTITIKYAVPKETAARRHLSGIPQSVWSQSSPVIECQDNQTLVEVLQKLWARRPGLGSDSGSNTSSIPGRASVAGSGKNSAAAMARPSARPPYDKPFYVGIWLGELVPDNLHTLSLFAELDTERKRTRLASTMDAVNSKYRTDMIAPASMLLARAAAPTRIAFTNIPDLF